MSMGDKMKKWDLRFILLMLGCASYCILLTGCFEEVQCQNITITNTTTIYTNITLQPTMEDVLEVCGNLTTETSGNSQNIKNTDYINRIILLDKRLDECYAMNLTYEKNCSIALDDCEDRLDEIEDLLE